MLHEPLYVGLTFVPVGDLLWDGLGPVPEVDMAALLVAVVAMQRIAVPVRYIPTEGVAR
jgi:hypothetical protein